jgi:TldD protein
LKRKDFLYLTGMGFGASMLSRIPVFGSPVQHNGILNGADTALKKKMADVALNAARSKGATYTDVRIGRYLNQYVITRENKVENLVDTESFGMGIRVIANGCWGFAATDKLDVDSIAKAAAMAVAIAKENSRIQTEPVQLAPQKGYGEVSWKTPIEKNGFEVPKKPIYCYL